MCADSCGSIPITRMFSATHNQLMTLNHLYLRYISTKARIQDGKITSSWCGSVLARGGVERTGDYLSTDTTTQACSHQTIWLSRSKNVYYVAGRLACLSVYAITCT